MQGLTRTARGQGRPSPAEARIIAALTGLGAELAVAMPSHSSQALRAKLMASAADPAFMAGAAGHAAAGHAVAGHGPATQVAAAGKAAAVTAKVTSAIAPFIAPVAAGILATNLAVGGAYVANHKPAAPSASSVAASAQAKAQKAQTTVKEALTSQLAQLDSLGHTYTQLTTTQLEAFLHTWSTQTSSLLRKLSSRVEMQRYLAAAEAEVARLSPILPAPAVAQVNRVLGSLRVMTVVPAPQTLPTPGSTAPTTAHPSTGPTPQPSGLPTKLPVPLPTVLPVPGITLGPIKVGPL